MVCRAYTFGDSYLAEVDIVLPASMSVAESHDIAEELQVTTQSSHNLQQLPLHVLGYCQGLRKRRAGKHVLRHTQKMAV